MRRRLDPLHVVDVFVYVVVLNLAVEYVPGIITETFTLSLLTAVLLKLVLEVVLAVKTRVLARIRTAATGLRRAVSIVMLVLILPGSKLLVLWLEDLVFGDAVSLGGFFAVTLLIVTLMLARLGVRRLLAPARPSS
ncbi:hypothetical protein [Microbacterium terricola]|uniref:Uncharacterized protein n=1 Tax=Microbacterium terricola TaxID=344163 RepID=A0ABM8DY47_9MICO|nr:hypothetical protein [Microbacterium terricola]UYK38727.1 hypothetical protein OAU46_08370 [Microbacterium terricola]BDV30583.1 hypothetical protein Microterr_12430 [Microbacterium terricola]